MAKKKQIKASAPPKETEDSFEERAIERVCCCKKESQDFYEAKFAKFNYFDRLYIKGASKSNTPYGRANLELPLAFQQIEPFVSQMTETMVGEAPYIAYEGRGNSGSDDDPAEQITDYTQYQLETGEFIPSWITFCRNLGKYGTAIMKVVWHTEIKEIETEEEIPKLVIDPKTNTLVQTTETITKVEDYVEHDGPMFHNRSLFDVFVPPSATSCNVQALPWIIDRLYRYPDQLLDNPNYSRGHKKLKQILQQSDLDDEDDVPKNTITDNSKKLSEDQKNPGKGDKKYSGLIEVLEWWGDFAPTKGGKKIPYLLVVALLGDEKILLRADKNPLKFKFKPFVASNDYPIEGEFYGYGELDHIKGLVEESTALRNARLDVANMSLNRMWLVERSSGVNIRDLYSAPNKVILTTDNSGIRELDAGGVTPSSVNELARIDFDIQNTTEIVNPRQDVSSVGAAFGGTATGVNFLSAKSNLRLLTKARLLEETFFKPLAMMLNWYNRDLVTDDMFYRVRDGDKSNPYMISPEAFLTPVDFKPTSNPQKLSIAEKKDNMAYLLQTVAQVEKAKPGLNNLVELMKQVYKLSGFPHPERYVNPQQTTVLQTLQGQLVDTQGQPVQVVPVDEKGQPIDGSGSPQQ